MEKKLIGNLFVVVLCSLFVLLSVVYEGSYAFFAANVSSSGTGASTITARAAFKDVVLAGTTSAGKTNMIPGETYSVTFTIDNQNTSAYTVTIYWSDVSNSFVNQNDLIYSLKETSASTNLVTDAKFPTASSTNIKTGVSIPASTKKSYTLTVTYKNTSSDQSGDRGKAFGGTIKIKPE